MSEVLTTASRGLAWLTMFAAFGVAIAAFARLKVTPSGLLIGGGFLCLALVSCVHKVIFLVVFRPSLDAGAPPEILDQMNGLNACTNVLFALLWVLIGVGGLLLPTSLRRLA